MSSDSIEVALPNGRASDTVFDVQFSTVLDSCHSDFPQTIFPQRSGSAPEEGRRPAAQVLRFRFHRMTNQRHVDSPRQSQVFLNPYALT